MAQPLLGYTYFPTLWPGINAGISNQTSASTLDASGDPTATAYKGMVAGTQAILATEDNTYFNVTLGTQATSVVKDDIVALVIEYDSYVAGNMVITGLGSTNTAFVGIPYGDLYTTLWTKQNSL